MSVHVSTVAEHALLMALCYGVMKEGSLELNMLSDVHILFSSLKCEKCIRSVSANT